MKQLKYLLNDDGYFPGPNVKITEIKWYKESLFDKINVNDPFKKIGSSVSTIISGSHFQHEFIVISYKD